jgi:hypothetical protein
MCLSFSYIPKMPKLIACSNRDEKMKLVAFLEGLYPAGFTKNQKCSLRRRANHFTVFGDDLCFKGHNVLLKVVFQFETELVNHIIKKEHETVHIGMNKMIDLIDRKYYGITSAKICNYVRSCEAYSMYNSLRTIQPVYINDIVKKYDRYMIDCVDLRKYSDQNDRY